MKKLTLAVLLSFVSAAALFAYNPPVFGDSVYELSSPKTLTGGASVAGGAIFAGGPDSIISNPAISAREQRVILNAGYTALISTNDADSKKFGSAFQTSILVPFKICILTGYVNGTFAPFNDMNLRNSMTFKTAVSKPITEKLDLGLGLNGGFAWGGQGTWGLSANIGGLYTWGDLAFMKNFRIGLSLLNLGQNYNYTAAKGIYDGQAQYPSLLTLKTGVAASLFKNDIIDLAYAFDITAPFFQNAILDLSLQFAIKDMFFINVSEKYNLRESIAGNNYFIPAVGINFKFSFGFKNNDYMSKNGWEESELNTYAAYRNINNTVTAASIGADLILGMKDTTPPVIELWLDDEE